VTNGGIIVPNVYSFANSLTTPNPAAETQYSTQTNSVYGGFTFTYQDMLTLDATLRGDASSTLPASNNVFLYPSVSAGFVFSKWKVFQNGFLNPKNTFGKLRLNYAEVGSAAPALSVLNTYNQNTSFGSSSSVSNPTTNNNPNLRPERSKSWEVGLEMSFANNRFGFDATYYNTKTVDQIMPVSISTATGFSRQYVNAGVVSNQGVELSLWGAPVRNSDWSWDINLNWTKNKSLVEELYPGADNLQLASYQGGVTVNATPGESYGSIRGTDFVYLNGQKVVSASTGRYLMTTTTNNVIGNATPNWLMGFQNKITYKNFSASFLIDVRNGGDVFSLDMYYGLATGLPAETAYLNDLGNPVRNSLATGGGVILSGVTPDGNVNTKRVSAENYGLFGYLRNPAKAFVYDASYVKLREVVLTYKLPKRILGKSFIKDASLSLFSRNLWIMYKNLPYADPEDMISSGNAQGYQSGSYPNVRTFGFNLKVGF
jgi:outer membrane receptor protein involved in Fe transport